MQMKIKEGMSGKKPDYSEKFKIVLYQKTILIVLIFMGVVSSIFLYIIVKHYTLIKLRNSFEFATKERASMLKGHLEGYLQSLEWVAGLYYASQDVERTEFTEFVQPFLESNPEIKSLNWIPRVLDTERLSYELAAKKDNFTNFQITEMDGQGHMVRAAQRKEYFPVYFVMPYKGNEAALGFDLASSPERLKALTFSCDNDELAVTEPIILVHETRGQYGVLALKPIFSKKDLTDSAQSRRKNLRGFVLAVLSIDSFLNETIANTDPLGVDMYLCDVSDPMNYHFLGSHKSRISTDQVKKVNSLCPEAKSNYAGFYFGATMEVGNKKWQITFTAAPAFLAKGKTFLPMIAMISGFVFTGLLSAFVMIILKRITERRQAENKIRQQNELLMNVISTIPHSVFWKNTESEYLGCNENFARDADLKSTADIVGKTDYDFAWSREQTDFYRKCDREVMSSGTALSNIEETQLQADGNQLTLLTSKVPLSDTDGKITGILGVYINITERKEMENALKQSEERFYDTAANAGEWIWETDNEGRYIYSSPAVENILGYKPQEMLEKHFYDLFLPDKREEHKKAALEIFSRKGSFRNFLNQNIHKDGHIVMLETSGIPHVDSEGRLLGYRGVDRNITDRELKEEENRQLKNQIEYILGATKTGLDIIDSNFNILYVDPEWQKVYGDPAGKKCYEYFMDRNEVCPDCGIMRALEAKAPVVTEEILTKENNRPIQVTTIPFQNNRGEWLVAEVKVDITDRKKAEKLLRDSEERYRRITNTVTDYIYTVYFDKGQPVKTVHSEACLAVMGYRPEEFSADQNLWINMVYPEDREAVKRQVLQCTSGHGVGDIDHRIIHKDGSIRWVKSTLVPHFDLSGTILSYDGLVKDVTERKKVESALIESEEKYRLLFEEAIDSIFVADVETGIITDCNQAALKLVEKQKSELIGKHQSLLHPPQQTEGGFTETFRQHSQEKNGRFLETRVITKNGEMKDVEVKSNLFQINNKKMMQGIFHDITGRKKADTLLRESEERLRTMFEEAPLGIALIDSLTGRIYEVNPKFAEIAGQTREKMRTIDWMSITHPDDLQEDLDNMALLNAGKITGFNMKKRYIRPDGSVVWINMTIAPMQVEFKTQHRHLCMIEDMTQSKQIEDERAQMQTQLRQTQKMEAIGTLAGGIAHDFNNILAALIGYADLALDDTSKGTKVYENIEEVLVAANRAKELVKQILTFSRKDEARLVPVNINHIIQEALKLLRASLPTTIEIQQDINCNSSIMADETHIHQVLMNLCTNAASAMSDNGGVLEVKLADVNIDSDIITSDRNLQPGSYVKLTVKDTGCGMSKDVAERIFEPFFTTKGVGKGTGLGLSVVHGIVENHNGIITVDSKPGQGTTFTILFPCVEDIKNKETEDSKVAYGHGEQILFVDDEQPLVDVTTQMLRRIGYKAVGKTNSLEALEAFQKAPGIFDLVIADQTMPRMTGTELAKELMNIRPDIPIILCTGFSNSVNSESAKAFGIRKLIMKPVNREEISLVIREILDKKGVTA